MDWQAAHLAGFTVAQGTLAQFIAAYLIAVLVLVPAGLFFLHHYRIRVAFPRGGHVPSPVTCTRCDGAGLLDKTGRSFGKAGGAELRERLAFSHGTAHVCPDCRGAGFHSGQTAAPVPAMKPRHT